MKSTHCDTSRDARHSSIRLRSSDERLGSQGVMGCSCTKKAQANDTSTAQEAVPGGN